MAKYNGSYVHELLNKYGYQPDRLINEPVASMLVNGGIIGPVRMLFDRGREIELIGRYCYSVRRSFDFCGDKIVSERNSELGYSMDLLFEFVKNGDCRAACKPFDKMLQQNNVLWTKVIVQMAKESGSGNVHELFYQMLVRDINLHAHMKEAWKVIIRQLNLLASLTKCELTLFTFGLRSLRIGSGFKWIFMELLSSIVCGDSGRSVRCKENHLLQPHNGVYVKIKSKRNQLTSYCGCEVLKLRFKKVQHYLLVLLVTKKYELRVVLHNKESGKNVWIIGGILILITSQQLLPCDSRVLAWWLQDKTHYSRAEMLTRVIRPHGFHRSLPDHSKRIAYYMVQYCNTGNQHFKVKILKFIREDNLTKFASYRIIFTEVYSFIHTILITYVCVSLSNAKYARLLFDRGKEMEPVARCSFYDNGLIFMDAYDVKFSYELNLELAYHLDLLFGISNEHKSVKNREWCDASKLVDAMPQQDDILRSILILQRASKNEFGSALKLYGKLFIRVTSHFPMIKARTGSMVIEIPLRGSANLNSIVGFPVTGANLIFYISRIYWGMARRARLAAYMISYAWECFISNILSIDQQDVEYWVNALPISIKDGISCYWCGSLSITIGGGRVYEWVDKNHMGVVSNGRWNTAAWYFIADAQQSLAQLLNSASEATIIQVKEESANYIQLTDASYNFWIIMLELKVVVSEIFQMGLTGEVCARLQLQMRAKYKGPHAVFTNFNFQVETRGCEGTVTHTDNAMSASITYQAVSPDATRPETMLLTVLRRKISKFGLVTPYSAREGSTWHVLSGSLLI